MIHFEENNDELNLYFLWRKNCRYCNIKKFSTIASLSNFHSSQGYYFLESERNMPSLKVAESLQK